MNKFRKEINEKDARLPLGILSLAVGGLFFCPGFYFICAIIVNLSLGEKLPSPVVCLFMFFMLFIGTLLLLLALKAFTGNLGSQKISFPVLIIASIFFLSLSILFFGMTYIYDSVPQSHSSGRAIGGSFAIGVIGLFAAYKQKSASKKNEGGRKIAGYFPKG